MKHKVLFLLAVSLFIPYQNAVAKKVPRMDRSKLNIGAYYLQPYARTESHIHDVADCGIDYIVCMGYDAKALDLFSKYHIGAVVTGIVPSYGGNGMVAGKFKEMRPLVKYDDAASKFKDHPAIWGIDIGDEPSALDFPYYNEVFKRVKDLFPNQFPYLNLYPNYASVAKNTADETISQLGTKTYDDYILQYCENVTNADYICYDFYLYSINVPKAYSNLITVADAAKKYHKSMWIVQQVNSNKKEEWISENELRFQAFSAMAFGVENITWGCYTAGWWHNQVLDDKGNKTQQFDKLKKVNAEIHHIASPYMKYKWHSTSFVGFQGTDWLEGVSAEPLAEYNNDKVSQLRATDNSPLLIGSMSSRIGKKREALFVCSADDPYDKNPKRHFVHFKVKGKEKVKITTQDGHYTVKLNKGGLCGFQLMSNNTVLIEL